MDDKQLETIEICEMKFKNWNLGTDDPETREATEKLCENLQAYWKAHRENIKKGYQALVMFVSKCPYGGHPVKGSTKPTFINKPHHRKRRR